MPDALLFKPAVTRTRRGASRKVETQAARSAIWKRLLGLLIVVLLIPCVFVAVEHLQVAATKPIKNVLIKGNIKYLDQAQVQEALLPHLGQGFFRIDLDEIHETLQALPWVKTVELRRTWPDALVVTVTEQVPVAHWGKSALVNGQAEVFTPAFVEITENLPHLSGPDSAAAQVLAVYYHFSQLLKEIDLQVSSLNRDNKGAWRAELVNGTTLVLGRSDIEKKMLRFSALYRRSLWNHKNNIVQVDMRYTNGLAVQWRDNQVPEEYVKS
jgi:cell division protein FtsQ